MELGQEAIAGAAGPRDGDRGYAMAALLVGLSMMAVLMSMALPVWSHFAKREREQELIWRGQQYARAVGLFQRKYANTFPPTIDILVEQKFLRKKYKDPMTNDDFQPIPAGGGTPGQIQDPRNRERQGGPAPQTGFTLQTRTQGGITAITSTAQQPSIGISGVVSKSKESSIKMYNGRTKYNEWAFVYLATAQSVGPTGTQRPGTPDGGSQRPGFGPQGLQGRPPIPFGSGRQDFLRPGQPPSSQPFGQPPPFGQPSRFGQPSPFTPPPFGAPRQPGSPGQPTQRPPAL